MKKVVMGFVLFGLAGSLDAFELATHGRLTYEAYLISSLAQNDAIFSDLGLENTVDPFGAIYMDSDGNEVRKREAPRKEFTNKYIVESLKLPGESFTIAGWLMRGAIREDDHDFLNILGVCHVQSENLGQGDDDPYFGEPNRPLNHFYDPYNNTALFGNKRNPDWALGTPDAFAASLAEDSSRRNHFAVFDTIESMYRALTGRKSLDGSTDIAPSNYTGTNEELRKAYWATTFRSLGDVVHLVEDMAQPQHTRLDPHSGACWDPVNNLVGHTSFLEKYLEARVTQDDNAKKNVPGNGTVVTNFPEVTIGSYPIPAFDRYGNFWSTREGLNGRGIADYSNREFFSAGRNLGDKDGFGSYYFVAPSNSPDTYNPSLSWDDEAGGYHTYLVDTVLDELNVLQSTTDVATRESIFTDVAATHQKVKYSLDQLIYDAQADLLLPRAVAYSAGVIDYFFRGRIKVLDVREDVTTGGTSAYRVTVKNVSEYPVSTATVFSTGDFSFYYKALDQNSNSIMQPLTVLNSTDPQDGNDPHLDSAATFAPNDTLEFLLSVPAGDWDRTQSPAMVAVFNGQIGLEPGIAAYVFSPPGLIAVEPVQDTAGRGVFRSYLADHDGNTWALQPEFRPNDGGANNYTLSKAEYLGKQTLVGFGYTNPLGTGTYIRTRYSSDNLGQSWQTSPSTLPARIITLAGLKSYNFEHLEFVESATLATIGVPVSATQTGNDFYSDYEVYLSTDAGQTWSVAGTLTGIYYPGEIVYTGMNGALPTFALLAGYQDPVEGLRVGFYRSTDGGQSWVRENDDVFSNSVAHDSISFTGPDASHHLVWQGNGAFLMNYTRYVPNGTGGVAEYHNEFYRSTDNGNSWIMRSEVPEPNDDGDPLTIGEVKTLQYLGGNQLFAYVTHEQYLNSYPWNAGYISSDGGMTWTLFNPGLPLDVNTTVTPNYHTNIYRPFIGALDNGAVPGQYAVP